LGDRSQQRGALFSEVRVVAGCAEVHLGGRVDGSSDFGAQWIPSAGVVTRWTPTVTTRALYAGGWRQPTWTDRYYVDPANRGTPTLQPEQFTNAEVGAHWASTSGVAAGASLDLAAFTRRGTNTIDWVRPIGPAPRPAWVATNVGTVTTRGVELLAATPPIAGIRWTARGSLLRLESVRTAGLEGKYALRPLTQSAGLTAQVGEGGPLWLLVDLGHAKRVGETPYTTVGGRIGRRWGQAMVSLELTNLGRARALDASGVPIAGPAAALGVTWRGR
jgi:iron complex outermembrane receptor protein